MLKPRNLESFSRKILIIFPRCRYDQVELDPRKAATDTGAGMMQKTANEVYTADYTGTSYSYQTRF